MGLFSRRHATVVIDETWRPVHGGYEAMTGDRASMNDEGQATPAAYRVVYRRACTAGAQIAVSAYASYGEDDTYCVGACYVYSSSAAPGWSYTGYEGDPWGEVYYDLAEADREARGMAAYLTAADGDPAATLPGIFSWDGAPFPLAAQDQGWEAS